jgi:pimeloyl-ACP methyl ester carboxylesterase
VHAEITLHDLAQDVVDVMAHVGFSSAWITGHATGGALARVVALDHAEHVEGVVLLGVEAADGAEAEARRAMDAVLAGADEAAELEAAAVLGGDAEPAFARSVLARHLDVGGALVYDAALAATPVTHWAPLGQNYAVLVVQGTADRLNTPLEAEALQRSAPERVSLTLVEGAGHLGILTHAGEVGFAVEDYLAWD